MDKPGSMSQITNGQAGLLKAFRLPRNAFAGTEIVADILVLRKNVTDKLSGNLKWDETGDNTGRMEINGYCAAHPEHVFGTLSNTGKMCGKVGTPTVLPDEKSLTEHFNAVRKTVELKAKTDLFGNSVPKAKPEQEIGLFDIEPQIIPPDFKVVFYEGRTNIVEELKAPDNCREYNSHPYRRYRR